MLSELIIAYLFLGGIGSGACLVSCVLCAFVPSERIASCREGRVLLWAPVEYRRFLVPPFVVSAICFSVGAACLVGDLGRADRLLLLVISPRPTLIVIGMWSIVLATAAAVANGAAWAGLVRNVSLRISRVAEIGGIVFSGIAMVYTGLLLWQTSYAIPFWSNALIPGLFVASSISSGMAIVVALAAVTGVDSLFRPVLRHLALFDIIIVAIEAVMVVCLFAWAFGFSSGTSSPLSVAVLESVRILLFESQADLFWGGFIGVGIIGSLLGDVVLVRRGSLGARATLVLAACVLVGSLALRWCIAMAGVRPIPAMGV